MRIGLHEVIWESVVGGHRVLHESGGGGDHAVGGDGDPLVVAVEEIERLGNKVEFVAFAEPQAAGDAEVSRSLVWAGEGVTARAGETLVEVVRVLIGIAGDGGVEGASTAGKLPRGRNQVYIA